MTAAPARTYNRTPIAKIRRECRWTQAETVRQLRKFGWTVCLSTYQRIEAGRGTDADLRALARLFSQQLGRTITVMYDLQGVADPRPAPNHESDDPPRPSEWQTEAMGRAAPAGRIV